MGELTVRESHKRIVIVVFSAPENPIVWTPNTMPIQIGNGIRIPNTDIKVYSRPVQFLVNVLLEIIAGPVFLWLHGSYTDRILSLHRNQITHRIISLPDTSEPQPQKHGIRLGFPLNESTNSDLENKKENKLRSKPSH